MRLCGEGPQMLFELLARHLPQGLPIRYQFKIQPVTGELKLPKHILETRFGSSPTILEPHAEFTQFRPGFLGKLVEFRRQSVART